MDEYQRLSAQTADVLDRSYRDALAWLLEQAERVMRGFQGAAGLSRAEAARLITDYREIPSAAELHRAVQSAPDNAAREQLEQRMNTAAYAARWKRLQALGRGIRQMCQALAQREIRADRVHLEALCGEAYRRATFDTQVQKGALEPFPPLPEKQIDTILTEPWSGSHYSRRVWHNTDALAQDLQQELTTAALTGRSYEQTAQALAHRTGSAAADARRIVRTESTYAAGQAELRAYAEADVEQYQYLATLDGRTSPICRKLDGQIFALQDAQPGANYPPMHPNCRSTTVAYWPDEVPPTARRARNPDTGESELVPGDLTYEQWAAGLRTNNMGLLMYQSPSGAASGDGSEPFDIEKALEDYQKFLTNVPERYKLYLAYGASNAEYVQTDNPKVVFGLGWGSGRLYYNPSNPRFYDISFNVTNTHELAHWVDYHFVHASEQRGFWDAIRNTEKTVTDHYAEFHQFCEENDREGFLSDILSGFCRGIRDFPFGHPAKYWADNPDAQPHETFANLFGLYAFGNEKQIAFLSQNFPEVVREFEAIEL